jgi:hypothetical protein
VVWASDLRWQIKALLTMQVCQFSFYLLAGLTVAINLILIYMGAEYLQAVANLGLFVTGLGLAASMTYLWLGQRMLGREQASHLWRTIMLAMIFPTGLVLANARATYEAFTGADMNFVRTAKAGTVQIGGWRGGPEIFVGLMLPFFVLAESAWSAPFFIFAVAGLLSIGIMGFSGSPRLDARAARAELPPAE